MLPGVYDDEPTGLAGYNARVVITNSWIWLRSSGGKEKTIISGKWANTANGLGDDAIGCIVATKVGFIVEGFTLCNGATTGDNGSRKGGGAVDAKAQSYYNYVCDCVISNNTAYYGGAANSCTLLKCKVVGNTAIANASAIYNGYAYNSVFYNNSSPAEMFRYCKWIIGCTMVGNASNAGWQGANTCFYNSLLIDHTGKFGVTGHNKYNTYATNCVFSCASTEFQGYENCKFDVDGHHVVAAPFGDFSLLQNSVAIGKGDASYVSSWKINTGKYSEWENYLEANYRYRDYNGNPISDTGAINCGAIQAPKNPQGGCVVFTGDVNQVIWHTSAGAVSLKNNYAYAYAESYPTQWAVQATFKNSKPLFKYEITPTNTSQLCHYPEFDGTLRFSPPPKNEVITNNARASHYVLYVDCNSRAESPDGSTPENAFATIQDAVDSAQVGYNKWTYISVAPGTYDKGGAVYRGLTNRVSITNRYLRIVSTHGAEKTRIVGARGSSSDGFAPDAVRCVAWYNGSRVGCLQGFTLTGGYTDATPEGVNVHTEKAAAGAYFGSMEHVLDCIITNNYAHWSAAGMSGNFFRCLIADNHAVRQGILWGANCHLSSCRIEKNKVGDQSNPWAIRNEVNARFCTIDDSIGRSCKISACIIKGDHEIGVKTTLNNCIIDGPVCDDTVTLNNCRFANSELVGGDDLRLLSCSPAINYAQLANLQEHLRYMTGDFNSRPLRFNPDNSAFTAGAYHWPVQAVSVTVSRGSTEPLTIAGGNYGMNGLDGGKSIVVTAKAKSASGRRFLGFTVNGEDLPASELSYSVTQSGEPSGLFSIVANYSAIPMTVIIR